MAQERPASLRDATARAIRRAQQATERGRAGRGWSLLERAARRAADDDGRIPIALGAALPVDPVEPDETWRARAARARDLLETFLAAAPEDPDADRAARLRSWALALAGDHEQAIERAAAAVGLQDRPASELLRRLATLAVVRGDLPAARRALLAAHRAMPQDNGVLSDLGAVELALGRPRAAMERFARILGRRPQDLEARRDLAGALVAAGRPEAAVEVLERAAERHPDAVDLWLELSHAAREAGDGAAAERAARAAIRHLEGSDGRGHTALGFALLELGRATDAGSAFEEALRRDPSEARARQGLSALRAQASPSAPPPGHRDSDDGPASELSAP